MTVLDYITEWERAEDKVPFTDRRQGDAFMMTWCYQCALNKGFCTLIGVALMGRTPAQWLETDESSATGRYICGEWTKL